MKKTMALCVPVRGRLSETKGVWGLLRTTFEGEVFVSDALEDCETEVFLRRLFKRDLVYIKSGGKEFLQQMNALVEAALKHDILVFTHNDTYLYSGWQELTFKAFEEERVGFVAAFGVRGTLPGGGRIDSMSNMVEAELHGRRSLRFEYVTHGDGFFLAFRKEALEATKGFDTRYKRFHFYDRDICLSILEKGYIGKYAPIFCHHRSGVTACSSDYQEYVNQIRGVKEGGDKLDHDENMKIFDEKWAQKLPVMLDENGEFIEGGFWKCKKWR